MQFSSLLDYMGGRPGHALHRNDRHLEISSPRRRIFYFQIAIASLARIFAKGVPRAQIKSATQEVPPATSRQRRRRSFAANKPTMPVPDVVSSIPECIDEQEKIRGFFTPNRHSRHGDSSSRCTRHSLPGYVVVVVVLEQDSHSRSEDAKEQQQQCHSLMNQQQRTRPGDQFSLAGAQWK